MGTVSALSIHQETQRSDYFSMCHRGGWKMLSSGTQLTLEDRSVLILLSVIHQIP